MGKVSICKNYYIVTDTHLGHDKIIEYGRPDNFEAKIKKGLLSVVKSKDVLIHLGDVCLSNYEENHNWFKKNLKCKTILVLGNHDTKTNSFFLSNGWDFICKRFSLKIFGKKITFSHCPISWDGYYDINIHGHFHNTDHRRHEPQFNDILTDKHKLLAIEYTNYQPVNLEKFI